MRIELAPRIIVDDEICFGKPTIEGTRMPVEIVLGRLGGGMAVDEVADEYGLSRDDILASLRYAAHLVTRKRRRGLRLPTSPSTQ